MTRLCTPSQTLNISQGIGTYFDGLEQTLQVLKTVPIDLDWGSPILSINRGSGRRDRLGWV
ncbi:MAG: hypothetical protein ACO4CG_09745 [Prochlorothrix sp.]|nr:hypothetical protein [Prochlorothrix sp.]